VTGANATVNAAGRSAREPTTSRVVRDAWSASLAGLTAVVLFGAAINVLKFASPLYLLQVLDRVVASRSVETLVMLTLIAVAAVLTAVALEAVRRRMLARWGAWIEHRFGTHLFRAGLEPANTADAPKVRPALDDLAKIKRFVGRPLIAWLDVYWAPVFLLGVFLVHPLLGWFGVAGVALVIVLGILQELATRGARREARTASQESREIATSAERNFDTVGALSMSASLADRWDESARAGSRERERSDGRRTAFAAVIQGVGGLLRIGAIGLGVWLVLQNQLSLGGLFAARVMMGFGFRLVERPIRYWRTSRDAVLAYGAVKARLARSETAAPASISTAAGEAALVLDRVSFRYPNQRDYLVRQLSLERPPGSMLVVTGPAASGKTTLSRLIVGLLKPRYGQVRLGDVDITRIPADVRDRLVGYLPQNTQLFHGSIRQNIARMGLGDFDEVVAAAKLADVHATIVRLPQGYDTTLDPDAVTLSGSECKRIAVARALYGRPRLLVLDEPTANMDRPSRRALESAMAGAKADGATVVVTTQTTQTARLSRLADTVLVIGGNRIQVSEGGREAKVDSGDGDGRDPSPGLRPVE
jgi:PrtD family type I secretion system ABC transporter